MLRFTFRASMALDAVLKILNALFSMFATDPGRCVFVASIAAVSTEVAVRVTRRARRVVVAIQHEELAMIKG
jgi:spore maturation protein SpmB